MNGMNWGGETMDSLGLAGAMAAGTQNRQYRQDNDLGMMIKQAQEQRNAQMHPLEMQSKQADTAYKQTQTSTANDEEQRKRWMSFMGDFASLAPSLEEGGMNAAMTVQAVAQKHGIDPADPRLGKVIEASKRAGGANWIAEQFATRSLKGREERAKEEHRLQRDDALARNRIELQAQKDREAAERNNSTLASRERIAAARARVTSELQQARMNKPLNQNMQQLQATLFNQAFALIDAGKTEEATLILNRIQLIQRQVDDAERNKGLSRANAELTVLQALGMPVQMPQQAPQQKLPQPTPLPGPAPSLGAQPNGPQPAPQPLNQPPVIKWGKDANGNPVRLP